MNQLTQLLNLIPVIEEMFSELDVMINITNREETLYYRPGKTIDIGRFEEKITPGDGMFECIQSSKVLRHTVSKELFGVPFKGLLIPLKDEHSHVVGCLSLGFSYDKKQRISSISEQLASSMDEIIMAVDEISNKSQQIVSSNEDMEKAISQTEEQVDSVKRVVKLIENLSNQSTVLALNGSIEAARAGQYGKGFEVIVKEIQKLSRSSKDSVKLIHDSINFMNAQIEVLATEIKGNHQKVEYQASATEEILASINELRNNLDQLWH